MILFTSNAQKKAAGDWGSIYFKNRGGGTLSYCEIQYAGYSIMADDWDSSGGSSTNSITIEHSTFSNSRDGINIDYWFSDASITIQYNDFTQNNLYFSIFIGTEDNVFFTGNNIKGNNIGSISTSVEGNVVITGNTITNNIIDGLIWASSYNGDVTVNNNKIEGNTGGDVYGLIHAYSDKGDVTINNNTIEGNTGGDIYGEGAIYGDAIESVVVIIGNIIKNNTESHGIVGYGRLGCIIKDNEISNNISPLSYFYGGGIEAYSYGSTDGEITNNTISNNTLNSGSWGISSDVKTLVSNLKVM